MVWSWVAQLGQGRGGFCYSRWWAWLLVEPAGLVSFVMSQRMLRVIKERAERAVRCAPTVGPVSLRGYRRP
jgi:hypothetical protein